MNKTYTLETGPTHIPVQQYADNCNNEYAKLLSEGADETAMQDFFERNPCMLPIGAVSASPSHPTHYGLITKPNLQASGFRIPDFMWISANSLEWFPTLIEIEDPRKKVFTASGVPRAEFTQARDQLADWRTWFNNRSNLSTFIDAFGIPTDISEGNMHLRMILIYGRKNEYTNDRFLVIKRGSLLPGDDEELMSFDRIEANVSMRDAITVKSRGFGKYRAFRVPPVYGLGPEMARWLTNIEGICQAIDENDDIDDDRKRFLKRRLPYWRHWADSTGKGIIAPSDRE